MTFLTEAIKKLRVVFATEPQDLTQSFMGSLFQRRRSTVQPMAQGPTTLWRGMRNMRLADAFMDNLAGGSEVRVIPPVASTRAQARCTCKKLA